MEEGHASQKNAGDSNVQIDSSNHRDAITIDNRLDIYPFMASASMQDLVIITELESVDTGRINQDTRVTD